MSSLSKQIELYIKELLAQESAGILEIQRNYLSEYFHCVPSQINYVLSTRFTPAHGYMVETRRGGGGYVRIVTLQIDEDDQWQSVLSEAIGQQVTEHNGEGVLNYLKQQGVLTKREATLFMSVLKDRVLSPSHKESKDELRANILQHLLAALSRQI